MAQALGAAPRAATDPTGPTGTLATWLANVKLEDVPPNVRERAKALLLDGIGCAIVGAQLPWSRTAVEAVTSLEGAGDATIIGWGRTTSAPAAALLNGTFIQGFELDDFHPLAPLHSASLIIPSLLASTEREKQTTGARALLATIAGLEVGPRVGLALHGAQMLSRGWHSGSVFGTHAAAATAGVVFGLDPAGFEDALGLAGTQSAGLMAAQFEAMSKRMHHGLASRNGLYAAHLARAGYTGIKRVFEREYGGFLSTFGEGHDPDSKEIAAKLGQTWHTMGIVVKAYAAMGGLHSGLDAVFDLLGRETIVPDEIERIDVDLADAVYHHGWWKLERPITPISAQMNIAYALAVAILDRAALVAQFAPQRIDRDDVWALIPRVTAHHDEAFDKTGPLGRGRTRLRITMKDGRVLESDKLAPASIMKPLTTQEVAAKFRSLTAGLIDAERQSRIEALVLGLEDEPNLERLTTLLAAPVGAAFC